ncbi:MAG: alpha/beta fold hydrolase [Acidimicrobiia bacterium]
MNLPPPARFTAPSGLDLAVYDWGGDGPPTLLAHPTGFHGLAWAPAAERLVASGRCVWSFDFRGHGDSDPSPSGYAWSGFADDALAVVGHLGLAGDPGLLAVGHSKGGTSLLLGELDRPGTYPRIWAYEPIVFPTDAPLEPRPDNPMSNAARRRRAVWPSPDDAFAAYAAKPPLDALDPDGLRAYVKGGLREQDDGTWTLKCTPDAEAAVFAMGAANGLWGRLPGVGCPVLVACGAGTDAINSELAQMITDRLPHARLEVFEDLGHFGPMEDPDACVASMLSFAA